MFLYFKIFIARATVKLVQKQALYNKRVMSYVNHTVVKTRLTVAHYAELGTHRNSYADCHVGESWSRILDEN
jgi:hypothetical protein